MTKSHLIPPQQFGFQEGKNASDTISYIVESLNNSLDNKNHTSSVFFDLRKAFDTIKYDI